MNARKRLLIRLALSLAFGIIVAAVPLYLTFGGAQAPSTVNFKLRITVTALQKTDRMLSYFYEGKGVYPARLNEVGNTMRDGWNRPFLYSLPDGKPLLESLGHDGKRGGVGFDADLSNRNLHPAAGQIPFRARLFEREAWGVTLAALCCGLVASILVFAGLKNRTFEPKSWPALGGALLVALAMAAFGALVIATFHIPSGH